MLDEALWAHGPQKAITTHMRRPSKKTLPAILVLSGVTA